MPLTTTNILKFKTCDSDCKQNKKLFSTIASLDKNNILIVTQVNCGYLDFLENWILSLQRLHIENVIVVANDKIAFDAMEKYWPGHAVLSSWASSRVKKKTTISALFGTKEYGFLVKQRPMMIQSFLDLGYDIVYSDVDSVWMSNALEVLRGVDDSIDFAAASDSDPYFDIVDKRDIDYLCTGFMYVKATRRSRHLMKTWASGLRAKTKHSNQGTFNSVVKSLRSKKDGIKFEILKKEQFPPGYMYFDTEHGFKNRTGWEQKQEPVIVHANWVGGSEAKRKLLQSKDVWNIKGAMPPCTAEEASSKS